MDGTATIANNDYQAKTGRDTIRAKALTDTIRVNVVGDTKLESDETFTVVLDAASGATILGGTGVGTIQNDDVTPRVSAVALGVNEGNAGLTPLTFTISLSNQRDDLPVTVDWQTADGTTATPALLSNNDYIAASGQVTIPPKSSTATATV